MSELLNAVIPAKAGILAKIPTCVGMTLVVSNA